MTGRVTRIIEWQFDKKIYSWILKFGNIWLRSCKVSLYFNQPSMSSNSQNKSVSNSTVLLIGALGVVFGDIGTSPLYALKVAVEASRGSNTQVASLEPAAMGILSLIAWSLMIVVTLKYVMIIMRADNKGEGGVFSLTALVLQKFASNTNVKWMVTIAGTLGASLFFGDSVITPAISVLSAVEGLNVISPDLNQYVIYIALILITGLFAVERFGTGKVGVVFGPIMLIWFFALGLLGIKEIVNNPSVLLALNPLVGFQFLYHHQVVSIAILGSVVLAVTGGEALYADMGHFGRQPIQRAWLTIVFPCLLLNYFGQAALLIRDPSALDNPFYRLCPSWALVPMILLAFMATIIASQAVISGAFSIANQAIQLGYIPRLRIKHTSSHEIGQVYVSKINILLFLGVVLLVLSFKNSDNLASAYGISVTGAMAIDSLLAGFYMINIRKWNPFVFIPLFIGLFAIDMGYLSANMFKFFEGGWLPIVVATLVLIVMISWISGRERLLKARWSNSMPLDDFLSIIKDGDPIRVPGTSVFMVPHESIVPMALMHNLKHNKVLHERVVLLHVEIENVPSIADSQRLTFKQLKHNFYSVRVVYGFMEEPDIVRVMAMARVQKFHVNLMETSFFIGREKVVAKKSSPWYLHFFIFLHRIMLGATDYYRIPLDHSLELGGHIEI